MRMKIVFLLLVVIAYACVDAVAQNVPLVYSIENTGADCPRPLLLTVDQLPTIQSLPDPFAWADGRGRRQRFQYSTL